jgi:hypothetical protein
MNVLLIHTTPNTAIVAWPAEANKLALVTCCGRGFTEKDDKACGGQHNHHDHGGHLNLSLLHLLRSLAEILLFLKIPAIVMERIPAILC